MNGTPLRLKTQTSADMLNVGFEAMLIAVLCLGILAAGLYGWRAWRKGQIVTPGSGSGAQLEAARRISRKTLLLTIQWQGRRYLLAENGGQTSVIDSREIEATEK
jgi:hypothetical protein